MATQIVDGPRLEQTESVVEMEAAKVAAPKPAQRAAPRLTPARRWALGLGIAFIAAALAFGAFYYLMGVQGGSILAVILPLLQLAGFAGAAAGAYVLRSWWALLVVPPAAAAGSFLGWVVAEVAYTAVQSGLAAGFDPGRWAQGEPDMAIYATMTGLTMGALYAALGLVMGKVRAQERQRGA